ncbi:MAG: PDZ domain-containing protein [Thermoanaerobaculia bacterium]
MPGRRWMTLVCNVFLLLWTLGVPTFASQAPAAGDASRLGAEEVRQGVRRMMAAARDRVFPSLVHIDVVAVRYEDGQEIRVRRQGSGTLISAEGHVLTNEHVVQRGVQFRCTLGDRQKVSATMVGEDPLTDLAVLKINLAELSDGGRSLPVARFGDSGTLEIGDYVMAMGSPYSLSRSVTLGIVSNAARVLPPELLSGDEMELEPGQNTGLFTLWIQHDALINPGNSGGPLVDLDGDIVGINEMGGAAIGFAIPSSLARRVSADLIKHGEVPRSWTGASFRPTADAGVADGVLVDSVVADSPAARAGIQVGDVLLSLNGAAVKIQFPEEVPPLVSRIADSPIGSVLQVTYSRDGKVHKAQVVTEKLVKDRGDEGVFPVWGLTAQQVTPKIAREQGAVTATTGVLVTGVRSGSPAYLAQPSLAPGDLLQAVAGTGIHSLEGLTTEYQKVEKASPQSGVLVAFERRGKSYLTLLKSRNPAEAGRAREILKPWMGIATQPVLGDLGEALGSPDTRGYRITRVYPATAGAAAGLRVGDVVLAVGGERLIPRDLEDANLLERKIRSLDVGQTVSLSLLRDGKVEERTVGLELNLITPPEAHQEVIGDLGLTAREMTFFDSDESHWAKDVRGVIVERVEPAGTAALAGLRGSDLIEKVDGHEIRDLPSLHAALSSLAKHPQRLPIIVLRGARTHLLYLEPTWGLNDAVPAE